MQQQPMQQQPMQQQPMQPMQQQQQMQPMQQQMYQPAQQPMQQMQQPMQQQPMQPQLVQQAEPARPETPPAPVQIIVQQQVETNVNTKEKKRTRSEPVVLYCKIDDCGKPTYDICEALVCCRDYGCGKPVCSECQGRSCVEPVGSRGRKTGRVTAQKQITCKHCNGAAHCCSIFSCFCPFFIAFAIFATICTCVAVFLVIPSMNDDDEDKHSRSSRW